ncbi:unnamed protein product [Aphanomyces euteiches]|uniref:Defective in cullin neddylation protein n=1 Tax=Aphanomyces euteiches TaxID=100861 RepID=A0A6G0X233_9STRA|nr:hypothetical protein Ae201684_009439 [Aphanomyces euteiches]KAH9128391.1 hypothetical protein AeMF1_001459 [Aphanomyces euteiches]KAH9155039.1 hypothetical protein AeRB84_002936 [Aphanomyces euteiches]KAH9163216.1 hypothetical protein LEN26_000588 [Aphanomyces euteiches]KAH9193432.1 hypothetical protein AeNC1_004583 [Aphanomyces euteiches]
MSSLTSKQEASVKELVDFTNCSRDVAITLLRKHQWKVSTAADAFFDENANLASLNTVNVDAINTWFDMYADPDEPDSILDEGIMKFCDDIGIDAQDTVVLVIAWKMKASVMCCFTRSEFVAGMRELGCENAASLRSKIDSIRTLIAEPASFKQFYLFCFGYSKEPGQKSLGKDVALAMWELILTPKFPKTADWCAFLQEHPAQGVTRDTWDLFYDFMVKVEQSYDAYDENEAWPVLIDDYMTYVVEKKL